MPKAEFLSHGTPTCFSEIPLRRSPRFVSDDTSGCAKTRTKKNQVLSTPISAYEESNFGSEFGNQVFRRGVFPKKIETRRRSLRLVNLTKKQARQSGSRKPEAPIDNAESFRVLRRSPRFSNTTSADKHFNEEKIADTEEGAQIEKCSFHELATKCGSSALTRSKGQKSWRNSRVAPEKAYNSRNDVVEKPNGATHLKGNRLRESSSKHVCLETKRKGSARRVKGKCGQHWVCAGDAEGADVWGDECEKYRDKSEENQFRQSHILEKRVSLEMTDKQTSQKDRKNFRESLASLENIKKPKLPKELCKRTKMSNGDCVVPVELEVGEGKERNRSKIELAKEENGSIKIACENLQKDTTNQKWTDNQEAALRRAYFTQKPTPNFWKKVSRLVPGKSAQDCFNRIFSELPTPQQHHPRSRARGTNLSPLSNFSVSASKLLEPVDLNMKKSQNLKHKSLAQKTARHLLKKQHLADQNHEADLFSALEGDSGSSNLMFSPIKMLTTPDSMRRSNKFLQKTQMNSSERDLISPPVLKRVKNMALHEKYIDRLHSRDAKRKRTGSFQTRNLVSAREETNENNIPKVTIKAAKNALLTDATDFVKVFKQTQEVSTWEDADFESDEGECEDEF
ncbi:uncharacterized protein [Aristolochia californica]|uniref:uncharacterized protein n=1 Tax=Aristolochia californica TaxID=171875 RepID=UPI0035D711D6